MGFSFACYEYTLLPLVIKEAVLVNDLVKSDRNLKREYIERKWAESGRHHVAAKGERHQLPARTSPVGHNLMVIHRLIEMG